MVLKLGTRKSLLAWSQSLWVAQQLEALNPGLKVELVGMETQGDKILDKPLSQIEGKEFFTAELDHALLRGETHLTVHSMKDLSLDRPPQFQMAAVPARELPHDVILFHESCVDRLCEGKPLRIGTSSPRRLTLVPEFLAEALPRVGTGAAKSEFVEIRGNVNTRLSRVHESEGTPRKLDGVVLAFAGLERLTLHPDSSKALTRLLQHTRMMLVPIQTFPTAPAQGALAVECRADQPEVFAAIQKLHHPPTEYAIGREREILREWGGGCHQKLGASFVDGTLYIAGQMPNGADVKEKRTDEPAPELTAVEATDVFEFQPTPTSSELAAKVAAAPHLFFAHSRAFEFLNADAKDEIQKNRPSQHVWVSGWKSWKKLAAAGIWVEGCLEGQGYIKFLNLRMKRLLRLHEASFLFFSHMQSGDNPGSELIATYQHQFSTFPKKVFETDQLYWGSGLLFETIWSKLQSAPYTDQDRNLFRSKKHFCGPGKTADKIIGLGFKPHVLRGEP
ncbi:MAG: hydroxymethylbilane synthase [Bdellovibrionales bacterium]|nr:hydroxymethylbilane synthase [Bdellovibrionales bacterium]